MAPATPLLSGNPGVIMSPLAFLGPGTDAPGDSQAPWDLESCALNLRTIVRAEIEDQTCRGLDLSSWRAR